MRLKTLADSINQYINDVPVLIGDEDIQKLKVHTSDVGHGELFICTPSFSRDTHQFISKVYAKGVRSVMVHSVHGLESAKALGMNVLFVEGSRLKFIESLSYLSKTFYNDPTQTLRVIGITGTNGKTTTSWILKQALQNLGRRTAYMGTLGNQFEELIENTDHTTPFPVEIWNFLHKVKERKGEDVVIESTSQGLAEKRLAGINYDGALFTNLTQDHLDFHGTMQSYEQSKKALITEYLPKSNKSSFIGINSDDACGKRWIQEFRNGFIPLISYGVHGDLSYRILQIDLHYINLEVSFRGKTEILKVGIGGSFNVINSMGALTCLLGLGYELKESVHSLRNISPVPGRFETVPNKLGLGVIVDYAHTPDALEKLLISAKNIGKKKIITVFGCGGDRDKTKRSVMGKIASDYSNFVVVTSDNPRTEDPLAIINQILSGISIDHECYVDRIKAIGRAIEIAEPEDMVIIAGKGHENYQIIGRNRYFMDDKITAQKFLEKKSIL